MNIKEQYQNAYQKRLKANWPKKAATLPLCTQDAIVEFLQNDEQLKEIKERINMQEEELRQQRREIAHLHTIVAGLDIERTYLRELNHSASVDNMRYRRRCIRMRQLLSRITSDVARELQYDDTDTDSDIEDIATV